jgi:hypothetical protein
VACLSNLALKNPPGRVIIVSSGGLEALLLLLTQQTPPSLQVLAAAHRVGRASGEPCPGGLTTLSLDQGWMCICLFFRPTCGAHAARPRHPTQEKACAALANLACGEQVKSVMADRGAIHPLVQVCRSTVFEPAPPPDRMCWRCPQF